MNWFDLASHLFGILPMYLAYITKQTELLALTAITVIISFIYHTNETKLSLLFDEFASCALIIVTFMVYMNDTYKPMYVAIVLLLIVVCLEYNYDINITEFFIGIIILASVLTFLYEYKTKEDTPQRLNIKDIYFVSFISTQLLAIAFFVWDKEPYAHSLWHLFAFVSLGSAIAHVHENDSDLKRVVFYCLGSIPSRFFIAAILIHWGTSADNIPILLGAIILGFSISARRTLHGVLHGLSYMCIGAIAFIPNHNMAVAGAWLVLDTVVSACVWYKKRKKRTPNPVPSKKIQLENLRF